MCHGLPVNYRITNLQEGETAVYNADGAKIVLKKGRIIDIDCQVLNIKAPGGVNIDAPNVDCTAEVTAAGQINGNGGIPYFIRLAAAAGYTITISEPQPFRAGVNRAGDRLAREDIMWVWWVDVAAQSQTVWRFRAGSGTAGSRLSQYSDAVIESLFNRLKPAHTAIRFTYR